MNKNIGKNAERELVSILRREGFNAVRIPTSNSSPNPLPDIFATKGNVLIAIECKSTWESKVKIKGLQIKKLFDFLSMFTMDGIPLLAVKFKVIHEWRAYIPNKIDDIVITLDNTSSISEILSLNKSVNFMRKESTLYL